jgi:hypothetical protein
MEFKDKTFLDSPMNQRALYELRMLVTDWISTEQDRALHRHTQAL